MVENQMVSKHILVSLVALVAALFLVSTVAASTIGITNVWVDDVLVEAGKSTTVVAGETIEVKVELNGNTDDVVEVSAEIVGYGDDIEAETEMGPFFGDSTRTTTFRLEVPYDAKDLDELYKDAKLVIKASNGVEDEVERTLRIQREAYNVDVMSVGTQTTEAGKLMPVDVVIKNRGALDLDDLYVSVSIEDLGVHRSAYFGDIVAVESTTDDDDTDTVNGRLYLLIPEESGEGIYSLKVEVSNDDTTTTKYKEVFVENDFSGSNAFATDATKTVGVGETAEFSILLVNPSDSLKVYNLVVEADELSVKVDETLVAVSAGTSKTITVTAKASDEGIYNFNVNVFSSDELLNQVALTAEVEGRAVTNPVVVLTVVLAIIFIVLLIVLFVLVGKKPEKAEEFGESYY